MTVTLPDEPAAYTDRLKRNLNDSDSFAQAASGFSATFRFEILPDERYPGDPVPLTIVVADGGCPAASADREGEYDFALRGPYSAWQDLLEDEIDAASAVMGGPFDVEGSTMQLMQHRDAIAELLDAAQSVETEFR